MKMRSILHIVTLISSLMHFAVRTFQELSLSVNPSGMVIAPIEVDFNLTCTLNFSLASEYPVLIWYKGIEPVQHQHFPESGKEFYLTLGRPQFNDSGVYTCGVQHLGLSEMVSVRFGALPNEPMNCQAYSTNVKDIHVTWKTENNQNNNLPTFYKFEHKTEIKYSFCPGNKYKTESCGFDNHCVLEEHYICDTGDIDFRVTAKNELGSRSCIFAFNSWRETIPNAPVGLLIKFNQTWKISWKPPSDWSSIFELEYKLLYWSEGQNNFTSVDCLSTVDTYYDIKKRLSPYTKYYVSVAARYSNYFVPNDGWGESVESHFLTEEVQPTVLLNLTIKEIRVSADDSDQRDVHLQWDLPSKQESGGIIRGYQISVSTLIPKKKDVWNVTDINGTMFEYWIRNQLDKAKEYTIHVSAYNNKGISREQVTTLSAEPLGDSRAGDTAAITATVAVSLGLLTFVGLLILTRYILRKIHEINSIPNIPISIALELEADLDSNGYITLDDIDRKARQKVCQETFDMVVQENSSNGQSEQDWYLYSKRLNNISITYKAKNAPNEVAIDQQPYDRVPYTITGPTDDDEICQEVSTPADNASDQCEDQEIHRDDKSEDEECFANQNSRNYSSDGEISDRSDTYSQLIYLQKKQAAPNSPINPPSPDQSNVDPDTLSASPIGYLAEIPVRNNKGYIGSSNERAQISKFGQSGYTAMTLSPSNFNSAEKLKSQESDMGHFGNVKSMSSDGAVNNVCLPAASRESHSNDLGYVER